MSEVITISGKLSAPHNGRKRGDRVRIVIDGVINNDGGRDMQHSGTEFYLGVRGEAAHWLTGKEAAQFDNAIADARAAAGEMDPRQGSLDGEDDEDFPVGDDE